MKKLTLVIFYTWISLLAMPQSNSQKTNSGLKPGYIGIINLGYGFGVGDYGGDDFVKFDFINGYQFNPYISLGLGTGLEYYYDYEDLLLPLYADFRAHLGDVSISPYFGLDVGYSFLIQDGFNTAGFMINPSIGTTFKIGPSSAINLSAGYLKIINWESAIHIDLGFSF